MCRRIDADIEHDEEDAELKDFAKRLPQGVLDIEEKNRSNLFAWRGQFSPQLIECLLEAYCCLLYTSDAADE